MRLDYLDQFGKKRGEEEDRREGDDVDDIQGIWGFKSWRICFKPGDLLS